MGTLTGVGITTSMLVPSSGDAAPKRDQLQIKNLILRAWRERWSDVKWGIHIKSIFDTSSDHSTMADCLLEEALNGPGPNNMVLSYLMHSIFSKVIPMPALLRSISQYDGYHKPFCVISLVEVLDRIKDCLTVTEPESSCLELGNSLAAVVHWLLACMYSSLENLSDLNEFSPETEHTKIVKRCGNVITSLMGDPYLNSLMLVAAAGDNVLFDNLKRMTNEITRFQEGENKECIVAVNSVMDTFAKHTTSGVSTLLPSLPTVESESAISACVQTVVINSALRHLSSQMSLVASEILVMKKLKNISDSNIFCDIIHSGMVGLVGTIGTSQELRFTGFVFFKLPELLRLVRNEVRDDRALITGLEVFLENESTLEIIDSKLHCNVLELLLISFQKVDLLSESDKIVLLSKKGNSSAQANKANSSNEVILLKAEATLLSILKTLDGHGDYGKNQESILSVLSDMLGKSFQLILTAAAATGRLSLLIAKLLKLNQCSRKVNGETEKQSSTRAPIFDISFLMLCNIVQQYGHEVIQSGESDCFFEDWCRDCMIQEDMTRDSATILARCDQGKIDVLLSQYLHGSSELKTSLIFWHEICTNSVGLANHLLLSWEADNLTESDVKKVLDVLRSKTCCLPICMATWLCAYVQVMPEQRCVKAYELIEHLLSPVKFDEAQDKFSERHSMMTDVINKMLHCVRPESTASQASCVSKSVTNSELLKQCWLHLRTKSNVNLETVVSLRHLLEINGPVQFVSSSIHELIQLQHTVDLDHWRDMLYGVFHIELLKCTEALLSCVLPTCLTLAARDHNFVEPQIQALVTLTVDCILSCYHKLEAEAKKPQSDDDSEPKAKRQRLNSTNKMAEVTKDGVRKFNKVLAAMYKDFSAALGRSNQAGPQVAFIVTFFQELLRKVDTPNVKWHDLLPLEMMQQLVFLKINIEPHRILAMVDLTSSSGREKCASLICALRQSQTKKDNW